MCIISRFNLLYSSLVLLKIIITVSKGIYALILAICNEIEFSLKYGYDSHLLQKMRQRCGMDSFGMSHLSSPRSRSSDNVNRNNRSGFVDFPIYDLPSRKEVAVKHLRKEKATDSLQSLCGNLQLMTVKETSHTVSQELVEAFDCNDTPVCTSIEYTPTKGQVKLRSQKINVHNAKTLPSSRNKKRASNTKLFVKVSDGSISQLDNHYRNLKSQLSKPNLCKKETTEINSLNTENPPEVATLRQRKKGNPNVSNKNVKSSEAYERTAQSSDTEFSEGQRHDNDSNGVKNVLNYNAMGSTVVCQSTGNICRETGERSDVIINTNEVFSYSVDGRLASSLIDNSAGTVGSSYNSCEILNLDSQGIKIPLENSKADNVEGGESNSNDNGCSSKSHAELLNFLNSDTYASFSEMHTSSGNVDSDNFQDKVLLETRKNMVEGSEENVRNGSEASFSEMHTSSGNVDRDNFQDQVLLETRKSMVEGSEGNSNNLKATYLDHLADSNSSIPVDEMKFTKPQTEKDTDFEEYTKMCLENIVMGDYSLCSDTSDSGNLVPQSVHPPAALPIEGANLMYLELLTKLKPYIVKMEKAILSFLRNYQNKSFAMPEKFIGVVDDSLKRLKDQSDSTSKLLQMFAAAYIYEIELLFFKYKENLKSSTLTGKPPKSQNYVDSFRKELIERRNVLFSGNHESVNDVFKEKKIAKTNTRKNRK